MTTICEAGLGFGGAWNQDDVILFGGNRGLMRVSAIGGVPTLVTAIDSGKGEIFHSGGPPSCPIHDHFLFSVAAFRTDVGGAYIGSLRSGPPRHALARCHNTLQYSPLPAMSCSTGRILCWRNSMTPRICSCRPNRLSSQTESKASQTSTSPHSISPGNRWYIARIPVFPLPG